VGSPVISVKGELTVILDKLPRDQREAMIGLMQQGASGLMTRVDMTLKNVVLVGVDTCTRVSEGAHFHLTVYSFDGIEITTPSQEGTPA